MQDEPEFLQQERHRLDTDGLPLPDSSGGATEYHLPISFPGRIDVYELIRRPVNEGERSRLLTLD